MADIVIDLDDLDHIVLGTTTSPGACKIRGFNRKPKWDIKEADGQNGSSSSLKGEGIRQGEIDFYLVNGAEPGTNDFVAWDSFQRLLDSMINGPTPTSLQIYHPDLARIGVTSVSLGPDAVSLPAYDGKGGATYTVSFIENKPPKPKAAAKAKAKPAGQYAANPANDEQGYGTREKSDPNADAKRELAALTDEAAQP